jgi:hypothetical protein
MSASSSRGCGCRRAGTVAVLPSAVPQVSAATVNRKLAAVSAFYAYQARNGADVGDLLATWLPGGRGGWKPFLHLPQQGAAAPGRAITLKAPKKLPRILTVSETQAVLDGCGRLRDRFFFAVLHETGVFSAGHPLRRKPISAFAQLRGGPDTPTREGSVPIRLLLPERSIIFTDRKTIDYADCKRQNQVTTSQDSHQSA